MPFSWTVMSAIFIVQIYQLSGLEIEKANILENEIRDDTKAAGISNLGLTCWLGSLLQMIYHTDFAQEILERDLGAKNDSFIKVLKDTFKEMKLSNGTSVVPTPMLDALEATNYAQDIFEYWSILTDKMIDSGLSDILNEYFSFDIVQIIKYIYGSPPYCQKVRNYSYSSSFTSAYIPKNVKTNLTENLNEYFSEELTQDLEIGSSKCPSDVKKDRGWGENYIHKNFTKQLLLNSTNMPKYFIIQLKRFDYDWNLEKVVAVDSRLTFPDELDLTNYVYNSTAIPLYSLHGVVEYQKNYYAYNGGIGHYVYYVNSREKEDQGMDRSWMKYDDDTVTWVTRQDAVTDNFGGKDSKSLAYGLVYKRN